MLTLRQRIDLHKRNNATAKAFGLANPAGKLWDDHLELASETRVKESGGYYPPATTFERWMSANCDKIPLSEVKDHLSHINTCQDWCCK